MVFLKFSPRYSDSSTMKKSIIKSIIFLTLFSSWSANAEVADKAVYGDMLHSIDKAPKAITNSGSIELPCSSCIKLVEINKRLELKNGKRRFRCHYF